MNAAEWVLLYVAAGLLHALVDMRADRDWWRGNVTTLFDLLVSLLLWVVFWPFYFARQALRMVMDCLDSVNITIK